MIAEERLAELQIPSHPDRLREVRQTVRAAAAQCGCSRSCADDMVIAVNEACMNVIQHGYRGATNGEVRIEIARSGDRMIFRIVDFCRRLDPSEVQPREIADLRPGGLGTHLIRVVMDEVEFLPAPHGDGNLLRMTKKIT